MKKKNQNISNPDELNKYLQHTSPMTWIVLGLVSVMLVGFFVWSFVYKLEIKLLGDAFINSGEATLTLNDNDLNKLKVGQKVYISDQQGEILSFDNDGQPVVSHFELDNGEYRYKIVIRETRPIDFLLSR